MTQSATPHARPSYAYLGPEGTFTEAALRQVVTPETADYLPQIDVVSAIEAVRQGTASHAVVAIENSVEGGVTAVLDALSTGSPLVITREILVHVEFVLAAPGPCDPGAITRVAAHPHAWAQCRMSMHLAYPQARHISASSNTAPAALMTEWMNLSAPERITQPLPFDAALVPPAAVGTYGLTPVATGIADNPNAVTRFVVVEKPGNLPASSGHDKTTLVVYLGKERAGALMEMLEQFSTRGINLIRIESRPAGDALGRYCFSIDAEGHIEDERMAEALVGLHRISPLVTFLGSYPRADKVEPAIRKGTSDHDFYVAKDWVARLQKGEIPHEGDAS